MNGILPRLRLAGLGLPLVLSGCMSGILPGTDAPDPACVLLCALAREVTGEPVPQRPPALPVAAKPLTAPVAAKPRRSLKPALVAAAATRPRVRVAHQRPVRPAARVQVSVVAQAPAREAAPKALAMVPTGPAPVAIAPPPSATPTRSLSQSIPGSVTIMPQGWRGP